MSSNTRPVEPARQPSKRLAPPSLFVGPPSRNASETALDTRAAGANRESSSLQNEASRPVLSPAAPPSSSSSSSSSSSTASSPDYPTKASPLPAIQQTPSQQAQSQPARLRSAHKTAQVPRKPSATTDTWRALQSTLEEVELSALSSASIFGAEHSRALEELRQAQIELARAWARGEGDDTTGPREDEPIYGDEIFGDNEAQIGGNHNGKMGESASSPPSPEHRSSLLNTTGSADGNRKDNTAAGAKTATGATDFKAEKTRLEQETENDILLARKRRMANDRYFERINKGVVDVVGKLENVAKKMGGVEMKSQEIWGDDSDGSDTASPDPT